MDPTSSCPRDLQREKLPNPGAWSLLRGASWCSCELGFGSGSSGLTPSPSVPSPAPGVHNQRTSILTPISRSTTAPLRTLGALLEEEQWKPAELSQAGGQAEPGGGRQPGGGHPEGARLTTPTAAASGGGCLESLHLCFCVFIKKQRTGMSPVGQGLAVHHMECPTMATLASAWGTEGSAGLSHGAGPGRRPGGSEHR